MYSTRERHYHMAAVPPAYPPHGMAYGMVEVDPVEHFVGWIDFHPMWAQHAAWMDMEMYEVWRHWQMNIVGMHLDADAQRRELMRHIRREQRYAMDEEIESLIDRIMAMGQNMGADRYGRVQAFRDGQAGGSMTTTTTSTTVTTEIREAVMAWYAQDCERKGMNRSTRERAAIQDRLEEMRDGEWDGWVQQRWAQMQREGQARLALPDPPRQTRDQRSSIRQSIGYGQRSEEQDPPLSAAVDDRAMYEELCGAFGIPARHAQSQQRSEQRSDTSGLSMTGPARPCPSQQRSQQLLDSSGHSMAPSVTVPEQQQFFEQQFQVSSQRGTRRPSLGPGPASWPTQEQMSQLQRDSSRVEVSEGLQRSARQRFPTDLTRSHGLPSGLTESSTTTTTTTMTSTTTSAHQLDAYGRPQAQMAGEMPQQLISGRSRRQLTYVPEDAAMEAMQASVQMMAFDQPVKAKKSKDVSKPNKSKDSVGSKTTRVLRGRQSVEESEGIYQPVRGRIAAGPSQPLALPAPGQQASFVPPPEQPQIMMPPAGVQGQMCQQGTPTQMSTSARDIPPQMPVNAGGIPPWLRPDGPSIASTKAERSSKVSDGGKDKKKKKEQTRRF